MGRRRTKGRGKPSASKSSSPSSRRKKPASDRIDSRPGRPRPKSAQPPPRERDDAKLREAVVATRQKLREWHQLSAQIQDVKPIKPLPGTGPILDPWQEEAVTALQEGANVIVDAPTTAGKTRVVETYFAQNMHDPGFRACYTTPVKSLSNDKLKEFRQMFGVENVGIATGDVKDNLGAPIVVATLESYRNSLLGVEPDLGRSLVVFDEYHFLQDTSRGSAWEEAMILTPPHCQVLMLSASTANAEEFAAWLEKISGRATRLVRTLHRPVPLEHIVYFKEQWVAEDTMAMPQVSKNDPLFRFPLPQEEVARRAAKLPAMGLTPCIIYCGQRRATEILAGFLCKNLEPLGPEESEAIRARLAADDLTYAQDFIRGNLRKMLVQFGVGFHHSGMAPPARVAMEELVKAGKLRFCVATMGLSIGINFSVRSALISDYRRPGEQGFVQYSPSEILQMLGRAGRRGRDAVGFSLWPSLPAFQKFGDAKREQVDSRLRNDPTTFLGLLGRGMNLKQIENFYGKSFMRFRDRSADLSVIRTERIEEKLGVKGLPCEPSPAHAFALFHQEDHSSPCYQCPVRPGCHSFLEHKLSGSLAVLHWHLHAIGAITRGETLTDFGNIARYFPQSGGLLLARMIADGDVTDQNLLKGAQLMASLGLARFKEPSVPRDYEFPYDVDEIEEALEEMYPYELFEEVYDPGQRSRPYPVIREYNPAAGFIMREWLSGESWETLSRRVTNEKFGQGDLMGLIYRTATYLQSLRQAKLPVISEAASLLWRECMRPPLVVNESLITNTP